MTTKPSTSVNLGLPATPDTDDTKLYAGLLPLYNAVRNVAYALDSYTGNGLITREEYSQVNSVSQLLIQKQAIMFIKAAEAMSAGTLVNVFDYLGTPHIRKAQSGVYRCHAFTIDSVAIGAHVPICFFGLCPFIGGLTAGVEYYVSASTPGAVTTTATAQHIGFAIGSSQLMFRT